jgi:hypothetical protein
LQPPPNMRPQPCHARAVRTCRGSHALVNSGPPLMYQRWHVICPLFQLQRLHPPPPHAPQSSSGCNMSGPSCHAGEGEATCGRRHGILRRQQQVNTELRQQHTRAPLLAAAEYRGSCTSLPPSLHVSGFRGPRTSSTRRRQVWCVPFGRLFFEPLFCFALVLM